MTAQLPTLLVLTNMYFYILDALRFYLSNVQTRGVFVRASFVIVVFFVVVFLLLFFFCCCFFFFFFFFWGGGCSESFL